MHEHITQLGNFSKIYMEKMKRYSLTKLFLLLTIFCADVTGCEEREFQCLNGQCIRTRNFVCDGFFNCDDKSDEFDCSECNPPYLK